MSGVRVEVDGRVATIVLDRPPLNVLDLGMVAELDEELERLAADESLQLVLLRGAGDRAFCAGVAVEDHTPERVEAMLSGFHRALRRLDALPMPTAAAVHGHCLGGGMELAAACDLIVADDAARFGQPEIRLGCYPPFAAALYPRLLGRGAASDLILTGRTISCREAETIGFVTRRSEAGHLEEEIARLVDELASMSAPVLRLAKRAMRRGRELGFGEALPESERLYVEELAGLADADEGVRAFLDKRPPEWSHR